MSFRKKLSSIKLTFLDLVSLILSISLIILFSAKGFAAQSDEKVVEVKGGSRTWLYPLDKEVEFRPLQEDGTCLIGISGNSVTVISSDYPKKICIKTGSISRVNQWIACLPHQVFITIKGKKTAPEELDAEVY